ncbi:GMP synthase [Candidatus Bathyarchaeota archaeon]|nr:GMP synthase [Candidatus Bathyarchaeota archaeon]
MQDFDPEKFTENRVPEIRRLIEDKKALIAVSGGVDSTVCAVLTKKAIGEKLLCVTLDDAFMRKGEPQHIAQVLSASPLKLPMKVLDVQARFLKALSKLHDAEEKRKMFRETFYNVLGETAKKERCEVLVQGTIKADIIETTGGVKTQHNVLEQMGINTMEHYGFKVVEPIEALFKSEVRILARHLGVPSEIAERQPFPGPGLSVRIVGEITPEKLDSEIRTTSIVEKNFTEHKPSQFFAATIDNSAISYPGANQIKETTARVLNVPTRHVEVKVLEAKATGMQGGKRAYGGIATIRVETENKLLHQPPIAQLVSLQAAITGKDRFPTRILYTVKEGSDTKPYITVLRAIQTRDFLTAKVSDIPWTTLNKTANQILQTCKKVAAVYYDITPKPPATVEFE